jgi:very-short-patch-repair endonuclease
VTAGACPVCGGQLAERRRGRPARFCGVRCRKAAYRARVAEAARQAEARRTVAALAEAMREVSEALALVPPVGTPGVPDWPMGDAEAAARRAGELARRAGELARALQRHGAPTQLESWLFAGLDAAGVEYERFARVGRWVPDALLTGRRVIFEADGRYWHQRRAESDRRRDAELAAAGYTVVRLSDAVMTSAGRACELVAEALAGLPA